MKRIYGTVPLALVIAIGTMVFSGCDFGGNRKHPLMVKALRYKNEGDYEKAVKYLEEYLLINPKSYSMHYALAEIYDDNLNDDFLAVYHYREFLKYAPKDSPDREPAEKFLASAEKDCYRQLHKRFADNRPLRELEEQLTRFKATHVSYQAYAKQEAVIREQKALYRKIYYAYQNQKLDMMKVERELSIIKDRNDDLKKQIAKLKKTKSKPDKKLPPLKTVKSATSKKKPEDFPKPEAPKTPVKPVDSSGKVSIEGLIDRPPPPPPEKKTKTVIVPPKPKVRLYRIQSGDTLTRISRKFYGSSRYYRELYEVNKDSLKSVSDLRVGQRLKIPPLSELKKE